MGRTASAQADNIQYPGDSMWIDSSATASSHKIPQRWRGKYVRVSAVGCDVYLRSDPTFKTISIANETTIASADNDADGLIATGASSATAQTISAGASFDGVIDETNIDPPRRVSITLSNHADWNATTAIVHGTDENGVAISESLSIPDGGNQTVTGTKVFASVTSLYIPAQAAGGGTFTLGVAASYALTFLGTEPHIYVPSGSSEHFRVKLEDEVFNHIESAASQHVLIALASGVDD